LPQIPIWDHFCCEAILMMTCNLLPQKRVKRVFTCVLRHYIGQCYSSVKQPIIVTLTFDKKLPKGTMLQEYNIWSFMCNFTC